jgi:aspartyl-tRNA(Asn)/glutamyl-tRNA(Gln) amidotransferase subunit C
MQFDDSLISKLEGLAKLNFAAKERANIREDLEKIISMIDTLARIDTSDIEPLVYLNEIPNPMRTDEVAHQLPKQKALANAPQKNDDFITIPKVIDL